MRAPQLERYEIIEELGQGGMSVVYRARDEQLARDVAIKVLHDFLAKQPDARKRFHREAVVVAKLKHPGILEIFDYSGEGAEDAYIVTELIDGVTLREFIERIGGISHPELATLVVLQLAKALKHAHDRGVVHRDLKPENVMVTRDGSLKLMDFGIAHVRDGTRVTVTGTLLGSPAHMAPEVIDGQRPDHRADLFSMGTILYWLATRKLPFEARNPSALFKRILDGEYDEPQLVQPRIGNGLARIIRHCLEPDRDQRYSTAQELVNDLNVELEEAALTPSELTANNFLLDPVPYMATFRPTIVQTLTDAGRAALSAKHLGSAMDRFNRVLAIDPDHAEVRELVASVDRRHRFRRRARQLAKAVMLSAVFSTVIYAGVLVYDGTPPAPVAVGPIVEQPTPKKQEKEPAVKVVPPTPAAPPPKPAVAPPAARTPRRPAKRKAVTSEILKNSMLPPAPTTVPLLIKIGRSWADVYLDGRKICPSAPTCTLDLSPGAHRVWVEQARHGKHRARRVEVLEDRTIVEIFRNGGRSPPLTELSFRIPKPGERGGDGWIPAR